MHQQDRDRVLPPSEPPIAAERHRQQNPPWIHSHDYMEFAVVIEGRGVHLSSSGGRRLVPGSVVAIRPGDWHGYETCDGLHLYNVYVGVEVFRRELSWLRDDPLGSAVIGPWAKVGHRFGELEGGALAAVVEALDHLAAARSRAARLGYLLVVLDHLLPALSPQSGTRSATTTSARSGLHPAIQMATQLLEEAPGDPWSLRTLAQMVQVSPAHLSRLFQQQLGIAPIMYLSRLRAERASALLLETDLSVAEVGRLVGWNDPNYMSRRFRHFFSLTPAAYRSSFRPQPSRPPNASAR